MGFREYISRCNFLTVVILLTVSVLFYVLILQKEVQEEFNTKVRPGFLIQPVWFRTPPDRVTKFLLDINNFIHRTHPRFLSFSIDSSEIYRGFRNPSLLSSKLRRMVSNLGGGYLRIGGTAADLLVFTPAFRAWPHLDMPLDGGPCSFRGVGCPEEPRLRKFSMHAYDWNELNEFASATGLKLLFDLNVLLRNNSTWNSSNAELLLDFSFAYQYSIDWQLGNEPNAFLRQFGVEVAPDSLGKDYTTLRNLLRQYRLYNSSLLIGPDVTTPELGPRRANEKSQKYLLEFLKSKPDVDVVSWHFYNTSPNASLEDYLDIANYEELSEACSAVFDTIKESNISSKPVWLTETGTSHGGGAQNLSDRFVGSLLWADKLGLAAKSGISVVVRQSLYRGHYALMDPSSLIPNPDYWVSALHRLLVRQTVLNLTSTDGTKAPKFRAYAQCSTNGSIVAFGVNVSNSTQGLYLPLSARGRLYCLTSPSLQSRSVDLNGKRLELKYDGSLPDFNWIPVNLLQIIPIPPYSVFFLQIGLSHPSCRS